MIIKILGVADLFTALFFIANNLDRADVWFPNKLLLIAGIYLLIKGLIFLAFLDFASIADIVCAIVILISLAVQIPILIYLIVAFFLIQKAIISLVSS